ncbi:hypothetical protein ACQWFR_24650, partial [Salmonella enterica subsp. enterica serovar Infantis]
MLSYTLRAPLITQCFFTGKNWLLIYNKTKISQTKKPHKPKKSKIKKEKQKLHTDKYTVLSKSQQRINIRKHDDPQTKNNQ